MEPQLREPGHPAGTYGRERVLVVHHGHDRLVLADAQLEQLLRAVLHPAGAEAHAAVHPPRALHVAVVGRGLEQRDAGLLPQVAAEEGRGVAADREHRPDGELGGVVHAREVGRGRAQVDLPGGVGALQDDVLDLQLQALDTVDLDPERLGAHPPHPPAERPVAGLVAQGVAGEVEHGERGQDADGHHPAALRAGRLVEHEHHLARLGREGREGPSGQRQGGEVDLQVEAAQLQDHPVVPRRGAHLLVAAQRAAVRVDQEELQLGADGRGPGAEPGPAEQLAQRQEGVLQALPETPVLRLGEPLLGHLLSHSHPPHVLVPVSPSLSR